MIDIKHRPPPSEWGVRVDLPGILALAAAWRDRDIPPAAFDYPGLPDASGPGWFDFCVLATSVVACLWPPEGDGVWQAAFNGTWLDDAPGLFACFARRPDLGVRDFVGFTRVDGERFFGGRGRLQQVSERAQRLDQVATVLVDRWGASASAIIEEADWKAPGVVELLVETVPGYRDRAETAIGTVAFDKLAHLCAAMMSTRSDRPLQGLETFPVYPDYMLPKALRHHGVLRYEAELARAIDARQLIEAGSNWEVGIRWATVFAAERLGESLRDLGNSVPIPSLDYALWHDAVLGPDAGRMGEHHRTVTMAY
ncbi:MAG TPA: queuosine salvage family protein [Acidimicrobiia bacterium]|nr:queuosine salvage family protein [Acidimicrobiia bacterium]